MENFAEDLNMEKKLVPRWFLRFSHRRKKNSKFLFALSCYRNLIPTPNHHSCWNLKLPVWSWHEMIVNTLKNIVITQNWKFLKLVKLQKIVLFFLVKGEILEWFWHNKIGRSKKIRPKLWKNCFIYQGKESAHTALFVKAVFLPTNNTVQEHPP